MESVTFPLEEEIKELNKRIADLKDDVIVWKRAAEQAVLRAENAERALKELHEEALDRGIERDLIT